MPAYSGGKAKIGKEIYKQILKLENDYISVHRIPAMRKMKYFEPFCGMLGTAHHFSDDNRKIIANDINKDIILMWKKLKRGGWNLPKKCDKSKFIELKFSKKNSAERGFYGIACTYSGIYYAGYRPGDKNQHFFNRARNSIIKLSKNLKNITFYSKSYLNFNPKNMVIYCDPPYKDNKFNSLYFSDFDSDLFWKVMRKWSKNNLVIISEYKAPKDFKCVWKKSIKSTFGMKVESRTEKLFIHKNIKI